MRSLFFLFWCFSSCAPCLAAGSTATGTKQLRIAIVDTGLDSSLKLRLCPGLSRDFTGTGLEDRHIHKHGSNVAALIARHAGAANYCLIIIKYIDRVQNTGAYGPALEYVQALRPDFVNFSVQGTGRFEAETKAVLSLLNSGTTIVAASGNNGRLDLDHGCDVRPACIDKRIVVVASSTGNFSNLGRAVDVYEDGSHQCAAGKCLNGTSQAAAIHTGTLVRGVSK
jgi:hypothetical protein